MEKLLDNADRRILRELQRDSSRTVTEIADAVGLSLLRKPGRKGAGAALLAAAAGLSLLKREREPKRLRREPVPPSART